MKILYFTLVIVLSFMQTAWAQEDASSSVDPQSYAVAQDIVKSFDMKNLMQSMLGVMSKSMIPLIDQQNPGQGEKIEKMVTTSVQQSLSSHMDELEKNKATVYAQVFTKSELLQLRDFYQSPIGQKMIQSTPEMMRRSAALDQHIMLDAMRDVNKAVVDELKKSGMKVPKELGV